MEHKEVEGSTVRKIVPTGHLPLHRLKWSKPNRPNLEITYRMPDPRDPDRDDLGYEIHLPEGSIHLSDHMGLDMALEIGSFVGEAARQVLDRTWKPVRDDEIRVESWAFGLTEIVADRLLGGRSTARIPSHAERVREVMLPTPWSPVMVHLETATGSSMQPVPLQDLHDGDELLDAAARRAPMAIRMIGGGSNRKYVMYVESLHAEPCADPVQLMRHVALVMGECG